MVNLSLSYAAPYTSGAASGSFYWIYQKNALYEIQVAKDAESEGDRLQGRGRAGPGSDDALQSRPHQTVRACKRAWSSAKKQANVECRIHDLRHHFISALAQTQTPDATIQAISGHLSRKMLEHYSHVRLESKRRAVEALDAMVAKAVQ